MSSATKLSAEEGDAEWEGNEVDKMARL